MNLKHKPRREPGYYLEAMDDELLLFDPRQTTVLYCNPTASLIWQLCDGERTVAEIVALLAEAYPEAAGSMAEDVTQTLRRLTQHGAIRLA